MLLLINNDRSLCNGNTGRKCTCLIFRAPQLLAGINFLHVLLGDTWWYLVIPGLLTFSFFTLELLFLWCFAPCLTCVTLQVKPAFDGYTPGMVENSGKFVLLFNIIRHTVTAGEKLLVFSQSLITLDLLEQFLSNTPPVPSMRQNNESESTGWSKNTHYYSKCISVCHISTVIVFYIHCIVEKNIDLHVCTNSHCYGSFIDQLWSNIFTEIGLIFLWSRHCVILLGRTWRQHEFVWTRKADKSV